MNVFEAYSAGYWIVDVKYQRGYVSRKLNLLDQPVLIAGGRRKGQLYYLAPDDKSTQYCRRVYIRQPE